MRAPYYADEQVTLFHGDCLDVLADLDDNSVDSVVTDPPYGLDFMGKNWDTGAVAFDTAVWGHALRVLKPGGHCLAFGGSRTWHRLAAAIEDSGFEIRDSIAWLYGSGFPKSLDVSKAIEAKGWSGRVCIMCSGSGRDHVALTDKRGMFEQVTGHAELPSPCRTCNGHGREAYTDEWRGWGTALKPAFEPIVVARKPIRGTVAANVVAHGTGALNIDACRVATTDDLNGGAYSAGAKDRTDMWGTQSANAMRNGGNAGDYQQPAGRWPTNVLIDEHTAEGIDAQSGVSHGDEGGTSRFFPTFHYEAKAPTLERPTADGIAHPTVKPLDLMRWLVRLVTPPHGLVLDPFAGSGTTAEACVHEHMRAIAIERETEYLPLIVARLSKPMAIGFDFGEGA